MQWRHLNNADRRWPDDCIRAGHHLEAPPSALAECHDCDRQLGVFLDLWGERHLARRPADTP